MSDPLPPLFTHLSRRQAKEYLRQFVAEIPASRARLGEMLAAAGADPALATDLSADSLDPIWDVAVSRWDLGYQAGWSPQEDPLGRRTASLEALGPLDELPSWFVHERIHRAVFSPSTLWAVDVLARHYGEVVLAAHPRLSWRLGRSWPPNNVDRHKPVVGTGSWWIEPVRPVSVLVRRAIDGRYDPMAPRTLRALYEVNTAGAPGR